MNAYTKMMWRSEKRVNCAIRWGRRDTSRYLLELEVSATGYWLMVLPQRSVKQMQNEYYGEIFLGYATILTLKREF